MGSRWFCIIQRQLPRILSGGNPMAPPCQGDPDQPIRFAGEFELGGQVLGVLAAYQSPGRVGRRGGELKKGLLVTFSS